MKPFLPILNAFIEDTCVLMVIAYLLARGRMLTLLLAERVIAQRVLILGVVLGLVGLTEAIFPGLRSPYVLHTLIITFATLLGGLRVGLIAVCTVLLGVAVLGTTPGVTETALTLSASCLLADAVRRVFGTRYTLLRGMTAGVCAQSGVVAMHQLPLAGFPTSHVAAYALVAIPANGFGVLLLQLLLNDARTRALSERHRLEAERAHALVAESRLAALRARVHPHFLFNALTSIAALCSLAPERAESSIVRLSQLMRRALEFDLSTPVCLSEEIEHVRGYLEIEAQRFGSRLQVKWEVDSASTSVQIPAFALQTLVENAVGHGIAPKMGPGTVRIIARINHRIRRVLIAVLDDGVGLTSRAKADSANNNHNDTEVNAKIDGIGKKTSISDKAAFPLVPSALSDADRAHGLQIVNAQLMTLYGGRARLRLFTREERGTLVAFAVPFTAFTYDEKVKKIKGQKEQEEPDADSADRG